MIMESDLIKMRDYGISVKWQLAPGDGKCTMSMEQLCTLALDGLRNNQGLKAKNEWNVWN